MSTENSGKDTGCSAGNLKNNMIQMGPGKDKISALEKKMAALGVKKEDIEEKFIKSSGRGGQKVNKTSSAVFLRHKKTNLSVKCGKTRSQYLNRFLAMRSLMEKLEAFMTGKDEKDQTRIHKIRKQKLRRRRKTLKKHPVDRV